MARPYTHVQAKVTDMTCVPLKSVKGETLREKLHNCAQYSVTNQKPSSLINGQGGDNFAVPQCHLQAPYFT
ncbi:MAG: hypothetical protein UGF45_10890 [Massilioclostridium sp.]|nr:hypothetical protein [Massilioclostridium sp.]MEE1492487.1 hypothetical protein [Massilioclostridium sp.]